MGECADEVRAEPDAQRPLQRVVRQFMTFDLESLLSVYAYSTCSVTTKCQPALAAPAYRPHSTNPGQVLGEAQLRSTTSHASLRAAAEACAAETLTAKVSETGSMTQVSFDSRARHRTRPRATRAICLSSCDDHDEEAGLLMTSSSTPTQDTCNSEEICRTPTLSGGGRMCGRSPR